MIQIKLPQPLIRIMLTLPLPTSTRKQILTIKPTLTINPPHPLRNHQPHLDIPGSPPRKLQHPTLIINTILLR